MTVPCGGGDWGLATHHRPVVSEWLCHGDEVSDGDGGISIRVDQGRRLDVLHGPEGHLLSDSCLPGILAVSSLLSWETGLSVPCIVLRYVHRPTGVYQSLHYGFRVSSSEGRASALLPGQLAGHCLVEGSSAASGNDPLFVRGFGDHRQLGEVGPTAIYSCSVSGDAD